MKKEIIIAICLFLAAVSVAACLIIRNIPSKEPKTFGLTFSKIFAEKFGFDWKQNYLAIFEDLKIFNIRIPVYWSEIEPEKGKWLFDDIDWQIRKAQEYNAKIILAIGRKLPRWPECHTPNWVGEFSISNFQFSNEDKENLLKYIGEVVSRYKDNPAVVAWQVENEPFLSYATDECPLLGEEILDEEIAAVRALSDKPIIVSDSGEFGTWFKSTKRADIFGSTLYRHAWGKLIGYYTYPLPPAFFRLKQGLVKLFYPDKPMIVVELQAEPWMTKMLYETSYEDQMKHFGLERFRAVLEYIKGTGFDTFYFWGVEWWYWLKQNGHPEIWEIAKDAIASLNSK